MNIGWLHFIRPYWLLALIPALAMLIMLYRNHFGRDSWATLCDEALLPFLLQQKASVTSRWPLVPGVAATVLAIIALAGPSWERLPVPVFRNASAWVIALDLSRSMDAEDIKPSRLIRARYKIADLLKQRKDGQTALLVFAGEAYVVTPLTNDIATIVSQLQALTTDIMPNPGNNAASALAKAAALLNQAGLPQGQILLVTDGVDTAAAKDALSALAGHYTVSVLAVGSREGAPVATAQGGFLKDAKGNILIPKLDVSGLSGIAREGGGIFQTITDTDADIQRLAATTNRAAQQPNRQQANLTFELWDDKGPWFLLAVLPLAALAFRKGVLGLLIASALFAPDTGYAFDWQSLWQNQDQRAQQWYRQKEYAKAAAEFKNSAWKGAAAYQAGDYQQALKSFTADQQPENSDSYYNEGNALAKSGRLQEAVKAYDKALELNPDNTDAKFNKDLLEKELEKQRQQQNKQNQDQQQNQDKDKNNGKDQQQSANDQSSEQSDKQQQSAEQQQTSPADNNQKPEQKPERSSERGRQAGQQRQPSTAEQQKQAPEPVEEQRVEAAESSKKQEEARKQTSETPVPLNDEQQQANEQWLQRIPDDPSGLLRRKFKYQYGQQGR